MKLKKILQEILYSHKWILLIFYFGLAIALGAYAIKFIIVLFEFLIHFIWLDENELMMRILTLIDIAMVANLLKMIVTGSYQSFVDKIPENTEKVSSGLLKVKMGTSLIGITSIHLLKVFIDPPLNNRDLYIKVGTHIVFLISAITLAWIDTIHSKSELYEAQAAEIEHNIDHKLNHNEPLELPHGKQIL